VVVADGDEGVLVNRGTGNGGYTLFVKDGHLHFDYNYFHAHTAVASSAAIPNGRCVLGVAVEADGGGGGRATLSIDGQPAGEVILPTLSRTLSSLGMDVGRAIAPVCNAFTRPFEFTGTIVTVVFDVPEYQPRTADEVTAAIREQLGLA
jgi:arylsulfatase